MSTEKIYIGKLREKTTGKGVKALKGFICKDDLLLHIDNIEKAKDGKCYIPIFIYPRETPDVRGNTHTIIIDVKDDIKAVSTKAADNVNVDINEKEEDGWTKNPLASED